MRDAGAQSSFREPMLLAVLDRGIAEVAPVAELILLGDVVDLWTYPPAERSPAFAAAIARQLGRHHPKLCAGVRRGRRAPPVRRLAP